MLAIPNTTTTATDDAAGAAVFPAGGDVGALTPYASGFLFIANKAAQISIRRGPSANRAQWTPYVLVSPTMVPISTDRGGKREPDYIFGVKAIDGVAGTPAQVFGALFQAGEAGFIPSAQFSGTVSTAGGFTPESQSAMQLISFQTLTVAGPNLQLGVPSGFTHLQVIASLRSVAAAALDTLLCFLNSDNTAVYDWVEVFGVNSVSGSDQALNATAMTLGRIVGATTAADNFTSLTLWVPNYNSTLYSKNVEAVSSGLTGAAATTFTSKASGRYHPAVVSPITAIGLNAGTANLAAGSTMSLYGIL